MKSFRLLIHIGLLLSAGLFAQNNALDFDGSNDYVDLPSSNAVSGLSTFTIEEWVYWDGTNTGCIYGEGNSSSNNPMFSIIPRSTDSGGIELVYRDGSATGLVAQPTTGVIPTNEWAHVVVTKTSSTNIKVYIDGTLTDDLDFTAPSSWTVTDVGIGRRKRASGGDYFNGKIDEVRIWDDVRTQAEIKANMHKELTGSESNLVAYYKFNESSGTTASDETSNSNDGTLNGSMIDSDWVSAPNFDTNYALDFDGSNDYVTTPIDADLQAMPSTTWSGWIKPSGTSGWQVIFGMEDGGWDRFLIIENGGLGISMGSTSGRWQTGVSVTTGSWQHVVAIYDNGAMRFYHNGTEYTTNSTEGNHSSAGTFTIGGNQNGGGNYYIGVIDEVAVWDEALTATEITAVYNSGGGLDVVTNSGNYTSSSNLVGYYKMNDGRGLTPLDLSDNSNHGTMSNMDETNDWATGVTFASSITALTINGQSTTTSASRVSKNGAIGSGSGLDANGQIKN